MFRRYTTPAVPIANSRRYTQTSHLLRPRTLSTSVKFSGTHTVSDCHWRVLPSENVNVLNVCQQANVCLPTLPFMCVRPSHTSNTLLLQVIHCATPALFQPCLCTNSQPFSVCTVFSSSHSLGPTTVGKPLDRGGCMHKQNYIYILKIICFDCMSVDQQPEMLQFVPFPVVQPTAIYASEH